ncbi:MAG: hypothetical protein GY859_08340, partial [Desulfobacterales bacterium]|nr:hypothetical protein [Desulfobacterales bacterium]
GGAIYSLEDLEDHRRGILLLLFTDGKVFHQRSHAFTLEKIARWPMAAWMDLGSEQSVKDPPGSSGKNGLPRYPASRDGIQRAVQRFMTERGAEGPAAPRTAGGRLSDMADIRPEAWTELFLGDALVWAQDCSLVQPVTEGLADALRVKFHPNLPPDRIECLYNLPNTTRTDDGLNFSLEQLKILRQGFQIHRGEAEREEVADFILEQIEAAEPEVEKDSLAYLSWEARMERVGMELGRGDLKRFGELMRSPLAGYLEDSLEHFGYSDQPDKIQLVSKPSDKNALKRLGQLRDNPLRIRNSIPKTAKAALGLLAFLCILTLGWAAFEYNSSLGPIPNLTILGLKTTPALLEIRENGEWNAISSVVPAEAL